MKPKRAKHSKAANSTSSFKDALFFYSRLAEFKKDIDHIKTINPKIEKRLADMEIHLNLLTRLLTTLCVEKFGIRASVLRNLVRRIEKEAVRDSQIQELESLYHLSNEILKKNASAPPKSKGDPWDQIS